MNPIEVFLKSFGINSQTSSKSKRKREINPSAGFSNRPSAVVEILEDRTLLDASNPDVTLTADVDEIREFWNIPTFTATLSEVSAQDVRVNLGFSGTATKGVDYGAWQEFIVVKAGDLVGNVQIQSKPDGLVEGDESIIVDIISVVNGTESGEQTVTINLNDDETPDPGSGPIPDVSLSVNVTEFEEYWNIPVFTATLSEVTTSDVKVNLLFEGTATTGVDYGAWQQFIIVKAGDLTGQVQIQSVPDEAIEGDEFIIVNINSVINGKELGTQSVSLTLHDDDTPDPGTGPIPEVSLSSDLLEISESWSVPTLTATLTETYSHDVLVNLGFSGTATLGKDYGAWQQYIVIKAGELTGQVQFQAIPEGTVEADESVIVDILSVVNATEKNGVQTVVINLQDNDTVNPGPLPEVTLSSDKTEFGEYQENLTLIATLSEVSTNDVTVILEFSGNSDLGKDYNASQFHIFIPAGELSGQVQIQSIQDNLLEENETVQVDIRNVINATEKNANQTLYVTLVDDKIVLPEVSLSSDFTNIYEDTNIATIFATIDKTSTSDTIVDLGFSGSATFGKDYGTWQHRIVIPAGQLSGYTQIQSIEDNTLEANESFNAEIVNVVNGIEKNGHQSVTLNIIDINNPVKVTLTSETSIVNEYWQVSSFIATLNQVSSENVIVNISVSGTATTGTDYGFWQNQIMIPAGTLSGQTQFQTIPDELIEGDETLIAEITNVINANEADRDQTATVILRDDNYIYPSLTLSTNVSSVNELSQSSTITATLNQVSQFDTNLVLKFSGDATENTDYSVSQKQIIIPAGQLTGQIQIVTIPDFEFENIESINIVVLYAIGATDNSTVQNITIHDSTFLSEFKLSDLLSSNGGDGSKGFTINGHIEDQNSGNSVSSAGDINGDGFDDLIIGAPRSDTNGSLSGNSYVIFGKQNSFPDSINLNSLDGTNGFVISGLNPSDFIGSSVSSAGDFNGDGFDDLLIGAGNASPDDILAAGQTYVIFGKSSGYTASFDLSTLDGTNGFIFNGLENSDFTGGDVSFAGDINGDGFDDILIGSPQGGEAGQTYVIFGTSSAFPVSINPTHLTGTNGFTISGIDSSSHTGDFVSAAGDINGDGYDDLVGGTFVFFGRSFFTESIVNPSAFNGSNGFNLNILIEQSDINKNQVSFDFSAGDINGDGFDDLVIGAEFANPDGVEDAGKTFILFGKATGFTATVDLEALDGTDGFVIKGVNSGDYSGDSVRSGGDINGDGYDDILIGASGAFLNGFEWVGETYLVYGKGSGYSPSLDLSKLDGTNGFVIKGINESDNSGHSVSFAGDINGDGYDDILIGARLSDPNDILDAGESYIIFGRDFRYQTSFAGTSGNDTLTGTSANEILIGGPGEDLIDGGPGDDVIIAGAGDDIILYDPATDTLKVDGGSGEDTLLITGSGIVLDLTTLNGNENYKLFENIEVIDLTGSGNNALIFNAIDVIKFSSTTNTLRIDGNVGDVIFSDQPWSDRGNIQINSETYYVYQTGQAILQVHENIDRSNLILPVKLLNLSSLQSINGGDGSIGFIINGIDPNDHSGFSVSSAGDVNGDGFDDLIIGAPSDFNLNPGAGETYLIFGKPTGYTASFDLSSLNGTNGFLINGVDLTDNSTGHSVSSAGDINGDGFDDLLIGVPKADPNSSSNAGETYVVFGKASGYTASLDLSTLNGTNGFVIQGIDQNDVSGISVHSAGDINGDGLDDLIIGAADAEPDGAERTGVTYVILSKETGYGATLNLSSLNGINGFIINGISSNDQTGHSVSSAGDFNGDGIDDLVIGSHAADPDITAAAGKTYVIFGKAHQFSPRAYELPGSEYTSPDMISQFDLTSLDGTNGFVIKGINEDDRSGYSVSSAGDINGDGYDDIIIGAVNADPDGKTQAGESYLIFGKPWVLTSSLELSDLNGINGFVIKGIDDDDRLGISVSSAGDINGDGFDDLIAGAYKGDPNSTSDAGESYIIFGKADGYTASLALSSLDGINGFVIQGIDEGDYSGYSVSSAGDINGDGYDDIIIGAPNSNSSAGESYVIFGRDFRNETTFAGSSGNDTLTGTSANEILIGGLGDDTIDGGSGDDVIIAGAGNDIILYDPATDTLKVDGGSGEDTLLITGSGIVLDLDRRNQTENFQLYRNIEVIDLTGSGDNTLLLSDLDVLRISTTTNTLRIEGNTGDRIVGFARNYSWRDQGTVQINSQNYHVFQAGQAVIQVDEDIDYSPIHQPINLSDFQSSNGGDGTEGFILNGVDQEDYSGLHVHSAGDINGDGYDDIVISTTGGDGSANNLSNAGECYVVFGSSTGYPASLNLSTLDGNNGFTIYGYIAAGEIGAVSSAGDINGDGFDDLIIGAASVNYNDLDKSGRVYVVFGKASGYTASFDISALNGTNGFSIIGRNDFALLGWSVSSAGDINGDGLDDIVIGAPGTNNGRGESYVIFGKTSGFTNFIYISDLDETNGFIITYPYEENNVDNINQLGWSVSSAGDINGDGFDDLILGANSTDPFSEMAAGRTFIIFGSPAEYTSPLNVLYLDGKNGFEINGIDPFDYSGTSVSAAGDVNGDGFDDLIIGAPLAEVDGVPFELVNNKPRGGESYLLYGHSGEYPESLDLSNSINRLNETFIGSGFESSGNKVGSAGDVNGDGLDDFLIGAYRASPNGILEAGVTYLIFGTPEGYKYPFNDAELFELDRLDGTNGFAINGISYYDQSGQSANPAGDINGDGYDDIIIGAYFADSNGLQATGQSYILYGRDFRHETTHPGTAGNDILTGTSANEILIGGLGDDTIDGGSGDDVIIAGTGNDTILYDPATDTLKVDGGSGEDTLLITGSGIVLDLTTLNQTENYQLFENIEVIDLTGSGNNTLILNDLDLLRLSSTTNTLRIEGNVGDSVYSRSTFIQWNDQGTVEINSETYHLYQIRNAILQVHEDIDAFSTSDVFYLADLQSSNGGNGSEGFIINGIVQDDQSGRSVSSAGDINGDGFDDVIIGARYADSKSGVSYILFGKANGYVSSIDLSSLDGTNGFAIKGIDDDDYSGYSVSSAGDINGDGFSDLIIGAYGADPDGDSSAGETYVIFGKSSG